MSWNNTFYIYEKSMVITTQSLPIIPEFTEMSPCESWLMALKD